MNDITMQLLAHDTRAHKLDYKHKVLEDTCSCFEFESLRWSFKSNGVLEGTMYKDIWTAAMGEELSCQRERSNSKDRYVVAVVKGSTVVDICLEEFHRSVHYL